jgi:hypothetical protein
MAMVVVPVGLMEQVVLANNDWVDHRPRGDIETQNLSSKEPSENQVREFANSFEKGKLADKVKIITKLAYKWPKCWLAVRVLLNDRNKRSIKAAAAERRKAQAQAKAVAAAVAAAPPLDAVVPPAAAVPPPDVDYEPAIELDIDSYDESDDE